MEFIRPFSSIGSEDVVTAGGKGASLGELTNAGIPVPRGFVVLSTSFDRFIEATNLNGEIDTLLGTVNHTQMHTVEHASEKIRALIEGASMPEDIANDILMHFKKLDAEFVAVRSSATAEDGASAAWAGQLDTYLNTTEEEVVKNVQRCFASLFTPRAIFYRFEHNLQDSKISVAVVVQKMVQSEVSGIAFSVHPVTQDHNQLIIEASYGLGEAIVSGQVTPDSYVVTKEPRDIIDTSISSKTRGLFRKEGGGNEWRDMPEEKQNIPALSDAQVRTIADMVVRIENQYGFPCDIEWAMENGELSIMQSRPITTLSPKKGVSSTVIMYEKQYTRDTTLIIQQAWCAALQAHREELQMTEYGDAILNVHYLSDGVIEVWEHPNWTRDMMDSILARNRAGSADFDRHMQIHETNVAYLEPLWKKGRADTLGELIEVVGTVFDCMYHFDWMYYAAQDERTPPDIRARAVVMRKKDVYFDETDKFIRNSLVHFYPHLQGYEQGILRSEIANPPSLEVLKERKRNFVMIEEGLSYIGTLDSYARENPQLAFRTHSVSEDITALTGYVGNKGYARGRVRIMKRKEQIGEAQEGDILVSAMTTPDFVPAMQKAGGIVTDEGGIMCHAAIVARELGKPCVIGTKIATQVFRDGDQVEVDADNGVVRKLA